MDLPTKQINLKIKWKELFPTHFTFLIFMSYIFLFVSMGLLTKATQSSKTNQYNYNYTTIILSTEFLKLLFSLFMLIKETGSSRQDFGAVFKVYKLCLENVSVFLLYVVPAGLYVVYNNLAFVNLSKFNPATYLLLLNLRTVFIGFIYQKFFSRKLSKIQWLSLIVLTIACMLKQISFVDQTSQSSQSLQGLGYLSFTISSFILMMVQIFSSVIANVYNEFLLKDKKHLNLWLQNLFMYLNGFILNFLVCLIKAHLRQEKGKGESLTILQTVYNPITEINLFQNFSLPHYLLILNQAFLGIFASLLLKYLNSIVKALSTAIEMSLSAVLQFLLLGIAVNGFKNYLAFGMALGSIYLYALNPILEGRANSVEKKPLVDVEKQGLIEKD